MGVRVNPQSGLIDTVEEGLYSGQQQPRLTPLPARNGVHAQLANPQLLNTDVLPYFAMPENYHGNQLKSYGGYLKYTLKYEGHGRPTTNAPNVILTVSSLFFSFFLITKKLH